MPRLAWRTVKVAAVPFALLLAVTLAAIDFGAYWDDDAMFTKVRRALTPPVTLLPYAYDYPGVTFLLSLGALAPEAAHDPQLRYREPDTTALVDFTHSERYRLRTRAVFAVTASMAVVWVAGLSLAIGGTSGEALLACALLITSWEVVYHLRWIAPDGVTMQFDAAAVMAAAASLRSSGVAAKRWRVVAAIAVGLATASKYSAFAAGLPLALASWHADGRDVHAARRAAHVLKYAVIAFAAFSVTSPGTFLQPNLAVAHIRMQTAHYATGHGIYTVHRGFDHLSRMLVYEGAVLMSPDTPVALAITAAAIVGAIALGAASPPMLWVTAAFPVAFTAYFALQRVMIARNLIVVAPFVAVLAARGIAVAWAAAGRLPHARIARAAVGGAVAAALVTGGVFQASAVESIRNRSRRRTVDEFTAWLATQPRGTVALSPGVRAAVAAAGREWPEPAPGQRASEAAM